MTTRDQCPNIKKDKKLFDLYKRYYSMISRCYNTNDSRYKDYGGRGITISESWLSSFWNFYRDMGVPSKGLSLDRINNNLGYCKSNCRWATAKQQANNTRRGERQKYTISKHKTPYKIQWRVRKLDSKTGKRRHIGLFETKRLAEIFVGGLDAKS